MTIDDIIATFCLSFDGMINFILFCDIVVSVVIVDDD
jgi:hypothetical protein